MKNEKTLTLKRSPKTVSRELTGAVTREEFAQFQDGMAQLMRNFLEFFVSYGLAQLQQPKARKLWEERIRVIGTVIPGDSKFVSREEFVRFQEETRGLMRNFLEFFITRELESGEGTSKPVRPRRKAATSQRIQDS